MRHQSAAEKNSAAPVNPPVVVTMPWRVQSVSIAGPFRLDVRFVDHTEGHVDLDALVNSPKAGLFQSLRDADLFNAVYVEHGVVTWPNGLDLAPDAMHRAICEKGVFAPSAEAKA